ncbi:cyclin-like protein [Conidiobolus coronatus NRRL 28638]|uniref:Cyclin-like protein n=1 Tax=Conidiobolus coronatus (strain ATCC 28846 / CBS 209.66 / NRRL 28638) TaxID=796925 RepID=A0A137PBS4_CONC2|nr:cyclin-like protein [Conidiobolus coronatus NRRL 28638]|eukprot:KXN72391.1 cyclin-like protein [Conidiobolus coronatus NRRL 28638]
MTNKLPEQYTQYTQFKEWLFTAAQLKQIREDIHNSTIEKIKKNIGEEKELAQQANDTKTFDRLNELDFSKLETDLSLKNCLETIAYFEAFLTKLPNLNISIQNTALIYFKRFYLKKSILDFNPKQMGVICIYLASKVENLPLPINHEYFALTKLTSKNEIEKLELILAEALNFDLYVLKADRALFGLYLDIQAVGIDLIMLERTIYAEAQQCWNVVQFTDLPLKFPPSILALFCFQEAFAKSDQTTFFNKYLRHIFKADYEAKSERYNKQCAEIKEDYETRLALPLLDGSSRYSRDIASQVTKLIKKYENPAINQGSHLFKSIRDRFESKFGFKKGYDKKDAEAFFNS